MTDWNEIRREYIDSTLSYRALAEKFGVSCAILARRAKCEGWFFERVLKRSTETSRRDRVEALTDKLLDRIEQAIDELNVHVETEVTKTKTVEYANAERPDKPTCETTSEKRTVTTKRGTVDRDGLKTVASTLAAIRDKTQDGGDSADEGAFVVKFSEEAENWAG